MASMQVLKETPDNKERVDVAALGPYIYIYTYTHYVY